MARTLLRPLACFALAGYLLAVTIAASWHQHGHSAAHCDSAAGCGTAVFRAPDCHPGYSPAAPRPACGHAHGGGAPAAEPPTCPPEHAPLHDDDCPVCQFLAQKPFSAPAMTVMDAGEVVCGLRPASVVSPDATRPRTFHSRAPPRLATRHRVPLQSAPV